MRVRIIDIDAADIGASLVRGEADLAECYPDGGDAYDEAWRNLAGCGWHVDGGGAEPLVKLERIEQEIAR